MVNFDRHPKLTKEMVSNDTKVGSPVGFREKARLLSAFGVLGYHGTTKSNIRELIYETDPEEDRKFAISRIDNIWHHDHKLAQCELNSLRHLFEIAFGVEAMKAISDSELAFDKSITLVRKIFSQNPRPNWENVDPLSALLEFANSCDPISISFEDMGNSKRRLDLDETYEEFSYSDQDSAVFTKDTRFKFYIPPTFKENGVPSKPLVLNFFDQTGHTKSGIEARAQLLGHVVREEPREGRWRISRRNNLPFSVKNETGRFGILAIWGLGSAGEPLFGEDFDAMALGNDELRNLYSALIASASTGSFPRMGVFRYQVVNT